ncbi:allatostatin-A receptor-like [Diadema antillarum]|uniref:allatostatin-A receptor-like n=1 Tax=Diadema antillarum TaxID=105358 RepID=UPI003A8B0BAE
MSTQLLKGSLQHVGNVTGYKTAANINETFSSLSIRLEEVEDVTLVGERLKSQLSLTTGSQSRTDVRTHSVLNKTISIELDNDFKEKQIVWAWYPLQWSWWVILQTLAALLGTAGNLLVTVVLFQRRSSNRSTDVLVGALAGADLITSALTFPIAIERSIPNTWVGLVYCKVFDSEFFKLVGAIASSYTLMVISVERYIAVSNPLHFRQIFSPARLRLFIVAVWIASFLSMAIAPIHLYGIRNDRCAFFVHSSHATMYVGIYFFIIRMVVPSVVMAITQAMTAVRLHRHQVHFPATSGDQGINLNKPSFHVVARNRVINLMFLVISIYIICWSPSQIGFLLFSLGLLPNSYVQSPLQLALFTVGSVNFFINPIIYTLRHPPFRAAIREMVTASGSGGKTSLFGSALGATSVPLNM